MRGHLVIVTLFWSLLSPIWAESDPAPYDQALRELQSDHFAVREAATRLLWQHAEHAETQLRQAMQSADPDVRQRSLRIWEAYQLGIYPDTPRDVAEKIYQFHDGTLDEKRTIIRNLVVSDNLNAAYRLIHAVEEAHIRTNLTDILAAQVRAKLLPLLLEQSWGEAESLLARAAIGDIGMRDYAVFVHLRGDLEEALTQAEDRPNAPELKRWLLRAAGRMEEALALGANDLQAQREVRVANGDALAFCEFELDQPVMEPLQQWRARAFQAQLGGKQEEQQQAIEKLVELAEENENPYSTRPIVDALLLNDAVDEALPFLPKVIEQTVYDIQTYRGLYGAALKAIGVEEERPPYGTWVDDRVANLANDNDGTVLQELLDFVRNLIDMDEQEECERLLGLAFDALENNLDRRRLLVGEEIRLGLRDAAEKHLRKLAADGMRIDQLIDAILPGNQALAKQWYDFLLEHEPEQTNRLETVIKTLHIVDVQEDDAKPKEGLTRLLEQAYAVAEPLRRQAREDYLRNLYLTATLHEAWDLAVKFAQDIARDQPPEDQIYWYYLIGNTEAERERWPEAAEAYEHAWKLHSDNVRDSAQQKVEAGRHAGADDELPHLQPSYLYLAGMALTKAGNTVQGQQYINQARLLCLGDLQARSALASAMNSNGDRVIAQGEYALIARLSRLEENYGSWAFYHLASTLRYDDPATALRYLQRVIVSRHEMDVIPSARFTFDIRMQSLMHQCQAQVHAQNGEPDKALASVQAYFDLSPGNASIGEELLPMLESLGKEAEARDFYEKTRALSKEAVRLFPKSAMAHNNLAWLDARSRRQLDEALHHAETANRLKPDNAAYLDTLAEVHFAMGDREKALELSNHAVTLTPQDQELLGQQKRFQEAPLPEKRAPGE